MRYRGWPAVRWPPSYWRAAGVGNGRHAASHPSRSEVQNARVTWVRVRRRDAGPRASFSGSAVATASTGRQRDHLPAARENVELVGKLELDTPAAFRFNPANGQPDPSQPDVVAGQIADVSVYKNAAYLAVVGRADLPARRLLLGRHLRPGRTRSSSRSCRRCRAPTTVRARTRSRSTSRRLPGRRAGGQQRAVRPPTASAASTSTTSATRPTRRSLIAGRRRPLARPRAGRAVRAD